MGEYKAKKDFWGGNLHKKHGKYARADAIRVAYQSGEDDESLGPRVLVDASGRAIGRFQNGD